jgi:hypothetical protein
MQGTRLGVGFACMVIDVIVVACIGSTCERNKNGNMHSLHIYHKIISTINTTAIGRRPGERKHVFVKDDVA